MGAFIFLGLIPILIIFVGISDSNVHYIDDEIPWKDKT
jgi:hypothetical protein